ncbi:MULTISPECIES: DUF4013 domain-containing protein [Halorussus]|uniref:DUF4013 domain-containing protein n=1 Tax=Halorussus TaxID=1070314 RepID=UPI00209E0F8F|nr:DUF4013 domain-containing protein [Halorussus vallis]USZ76810.1 DUF4013 domain-containing protein [Halorussus vallis]
MLREAVSYLLRGQRREEALLVGTVLALAAGILARLGFLAILALVPAVLLAGYAMAVLRAGAAAARAERADADPPDSGGLDSEAGSTASLPAFADFGALAADGLRALAVSAGYLAGPLVVLLITVGATQAGAGTPGFVRTLSVYGAGTVALVLAAGAAYLLPAALVGVADRGSVRAALDRGALRRTAVDAGYFVGWFAAFGVAAVTASALAVLAALGRPGEVAALALSFYALVVVARLLGRAAG